eukprot:scaffold7328_cov314-Pinguiococcus_pyrenoidosus.AAC.46
MGALRRGRARNSRSRTGAACTGWLPWLTTLRAAMQDWCEEGRRVFTAPFAVAPRPAWPVALPASSSSPPPHLADAAFPSRKRLPAAAEKPPPPSRAAGAPPAAAGTPASSSPEPLAAAPCAAPRLPPPTASGARKQPPSAVPLAASPELSAASGAQSPPCACGWPGGVLPPLAPGPPPQVGESLPLSRAPSGQRPPACSAHPA